jgi:protoheme IX farnesyltransferase
MLHYGGFKDAGYPTVMRLFGQGSLQRLTFVWLILTMFTGIFMVSIFNPISIYIYIALAITGVFAFVSSLQLLKESFELKDARKVFWKINLAFLGTIILIAIDEMIKFNSL